MKKIFFSLLAVAALASCVKSEAVYTEDNSEIKIKPATAIATKANVTAAIDGTEYPTAENFDVYGYWKDEPAGESFTDGAILYLGLEGAGEFTNKGNYWGGAAEAYYWPKNGSLRFAAYSPSHIDMTHVLASDTYTVENYVQPDETAKTWDLLVAPTSKSYTSMTAAENVSVVFEHALSWITINVKAKDAEAAKAFDIKKVTINDVITTAKLEAVMTGEDKAMNWTLTDTKAPYVVFEGSQAVTETATVIESTANGTLVIPQPTTTITVDYTQNALAGTPALENQKVTVDLVLDTDNTPWKDGKHYVYTLVFGLDEILINPDVVDWEDVVVGEIDTDKTVNNVSTEAQLAAALAKGGKVVLQSNITTTATLNVATTAVLDLNGYTLTNQLGNATTDVIVVEEGGELTINGEGTIEAVTGNDGYAVISEGLIIINGGTYKSGVDADGEPNAVIYARGKGEVYVNGGTFPNDNNSKFVLNKKDADRATTVIEVAGGEFENFNPGDNEAENAGTNFLKAGYTVVAEGNVYTVIRGEGTVATTPEELKGALTEDAPVIEVVLNDNLTYDVAAWANDAMGGASTEVITIDLNGKTLTFNQTNSDWNNVVTNAGKLVIKNGNITNAGYNDGPWNRHDINFACPVELVNVTSDKALAFKSDATLTNVTIADANTSDTYAIWVQPNGQKVVLDGCTIDMLDCTDGRGLKIDEQYVDTPAKVTLNVSNTVFKTEEKSAILVKSAAGADITLSNVDIAEVAADSTNPVWVDEASAAYADLVVVNGGSKIVEP